MDMENLRQRIDDTDRKLVELLNTRFELIREVGAWKSERNLPIFVPEREKALLEHLCEINKGPVPRDVLLGIYREIIAGARNLERKLCIAFLGPEGTFSHQAALGKFGSGAEFLPLCNIGDVFREVACGRADYGCVPVENSTEGVVNSTVDTLIESDVHIIAEFNIKIHHCLMNLSGRIEDVRCVYSHPQVLGQCRQYLQSRLRGVEQIEVASSTRAAELATREIGTAALASSVAAQLFGLKTVAGSVEDNPENRTRFLVIGNQTPAPTGDDKTSLCFGLRDRAGALYDALKPFGDAGITMSMIESRPLKKGDWEYVFFVDILGHCDDPKVKKACDELRPMCRFFRIFGSYPRSV